MMIEAASVGGLCLLSLGSIGKYKFKFSPFTEAISDFLFIGIPVRR